MITGGCLCGAVRFTVAEGPIVGRVCWCRTCQKPRRRRAGGGRRLQDGAVTVTGELRDYASIADSGNKMHRRFCPNCGTHIFSAVGIAADSGLHPRRRAGRSGDRQAEQHDLVSSAPTWACFDPNLPQVEGQPPPVG